MSAAQLPPTSLEVSIGTSAGAVTRRMVITNRSRRISYYTILVTPIITHYTVVCKIIK